MLILIVAVALVAPSVGQASERTLKRTLDRWSHVIAVDAHGIGLSASHRHPRRMALRARHFRADALRAHRALAAQRVSASRGLRAKRLALKAFRDYALVGQEWARSGQARLQGRKALATHHATLARRYARSGNRALVTASRLLR